MPSLARLTGEHDMFIRHTHLLPVQHAALNPTFVEIVFRNSTDCIATGECKMGATSSKINNPGSLLQHQQYNVRVLAAVSASLSITAAIVTFYWFCMMKRSFRRSLVMLLISGDLLKSAWFFIFVMVTFAEGPIQTQSKFCQVSGFMLQTGVESCDAAILLMSVHLAIQIFRPADDYFGEDGLYRYRYAVYTLWACVPAVSASLAFVRPHAAYVAQGAFCSLPIRPFWYRLALSWVPRYIMWFFVMGVAVSIYYHVGYEFRVFAEEEERSSSKNSSKGVDTQQPLALETLRAKNNASTQLDGPSPAWSNLMPSVSTLEALSEPRRPSAASLPAFGARRVSIAQRRASLHVSPFDGVSATHFAPPEPVSQLRRPSLATISTIMTADPALDGPRSPVLPSINESFDTLQPIVLPSHAVTTTADLRRRAIQRQLRLLFIYPCVYMLFWIMPFIYHCMNYTDYYAQHPVYIVAALSTFCQTFIGFADCATFAWREKPWRHIPGSDGSFWGSFRWWAFSDQDWVSNPLSPTASRAGAAVAGSPGPGFLQRSDVRSPPTMSPRNSSSLVRPRAAHRRTASGGSSDWKARAAERAWERLALERVEAERRMADVGDAGFEDARRSVESRRSKDWWDRRLSEDVLSANERRARGGL
ncbi:G protein-coupled receptor gpr1 [Elasticomyces elasticus]|nr:G protein-coupled receptor gpr1 [Elasticomyces elasticus]